MKKILINIVFFIAIVPVGNAQVLAKPELYFGATGGATIAKVGFLPTIHQSFVLGMNAGGTFRYITEKYFGMQLEVNISQMGWKEDTTSFSKNLTYIELPFLTHIYFGQKTRIFANLGPQIGFLLRERTDAPVRDYFQQKNPLQRKFDYGFALGLGVCVPVRKSVVQLEFRGYYGMNDIYRNRKEDEFQRSNNLQAAISLGWFFRIK